MKVTKSDLRIVRREIEAIAKSNRGKPPFTVFIGARYNTDKGTSHFDTTHMNVLLVSDDPHWEDTDLADNSISWDVMRGELETTPDGRAAYDFWIYERGLPGEGHGDLVCNAQAYFDAAGLARIEADISVTWERPNQE